MQQTRCVMTIVEKTAQANVLATAINNLKVNINITNQDLSDILGPHRNTITRQLQSGELEPKSKQGQLALLLIRAYRSLFTLNGGNKKAMIHWLKTDNYHIQGIPLEAMKDVGGLVRVVNYLDAMRGKV